MRLSLIHIFKGFADTINTTSAEISKMQNFCGLNIADQPLNYIKAAFEGASIALAIAALLIPILAWATQVLNYKPVSYTHLDSTVWQARKTIFR